ncbi:hypothetical protein AArc1_1255 [Natrarchaeobaculum sulfurireducens]|uniref:Uncharacterized protein n=1 Tax=Natrarchaeobaculum sulfurireducens TaxID=2044521 RepID=A0A346PDJ9_9EURY|nr:hypothetical protein AArc1_1255 [Natrarchaeobaculum sulfurireducens]
MGLVRIHPQYFPHSIDVSTNGDSHSSRCSYVTWRHHTRRHIATDRIDRSRSPNDLR